MTDAQVNSPVDFDAIFAQIQTSMQEMDQNHAQYEGEQCKLLLEKAEHVGRGM
jgi:hypothetical protein